MNFDPESASSTTPSRPRRPLPRYLRNLLAFQVLNAFSFTIFLGAPMVLLAKFLGAGEAIVGLLISLTPFLVVLQTVVTNTVNRLGYRRTMLAGWTSRTVAILMVVPLPLLMGRFGSGWLIAGFVLASVLFNTIRGFTSGAWLPWLSLIVPRSIRGYYVGIDQLVLNLSILGTLIGSGLFLGSNPEAWRYSVLMLASAMAGWASIYFLSRTPCPVLLSLKKATRRPFGEILRIYRDIWSHRDFRRITRFVTLYNFAWSAVPGFLIVYLHEDLRWSDGAVLKLNACTTLGILLTAVFWGRLSDTAGSRPLLRLATLGQICIVAAWILSALGLVHLSLTAIAVLMLTLGICNSAFTIGQVRLILGACPEHELTIGMSLYQVLTSLSSGAGALLWGIILQHLRAAPIRESAALGAFAWTPFGLFFGVSLVLLLVAQGLLGRIHEAQALPAHRVLVQLMWEWPGRVLSSFTDARR